MFREVHKPGSQFARLLGRDQPGSVEDTVNLILQFLPAHWIAPEAHSAHLSLNHLDQVHRCLDRRSKSLAFRSLTRLLYGLFEKPEERR